jgi:hypothetical protein
MTPSLQTGILRLGNFQQKISDRGNTIMTYIDFFLFWPDWVLDHRRKKKRKKLSEVQIGSKTL